MLLLRAIKRSEAPPKAGLLRPHRKTARNDICWYPRLALKAGRYTHVDGNNSTPIFLIHHPSSIIRHLIIAKSTSLFYLGINLDCLVVLICLSLTFLKSHLL